MGWALQHRTPNLGAPSPSGCCYVIFGSEASLSRAWPPAAPMSGPHVRPHSPIPSEHDLTFSWKKTLQAHLTLTQGSHFSKSWLFQP